MARKIEVEIIGDSRSLERAFGRAGNASKGLGNSLSRLGRTAKIAIGVGVGAGLVGLGLAARGAIKEFADAQKITAQTNAVIKSTGGIAGVTAKHVDSLANSLLRKTGVDDEAIKAGQNMLLTFKNVRNEIGKGNDIFDRATRAALDMDTAMTRGNVTAESLAKTNLRLGKALNDPLKGMTALTRVGVTFTEAQKKTVEQLVKTGHASEAQKLILKELESEFGGSAEMVGKTFPMQLKKLREILLNAGADLVGFTIKAGKPVAAALSDIFGWIQKIADAPSLKVALEIGGQGLKDLGQRIKTQVESAIQGVNWSSVGRDLGQAIGAALVFTDAAVQRGVRSLINAIRAHAQEFAELGAELAVRMVSTLMDPAFWAKHIDLLAVLISVRFGGALLGRFALLGRQVAGRFVTGLIQRLAPIAVVVANIFARIPAVIRVPFEVAAKLAGQAIGFVVRTLRNDLRAVLAAIPGWIKAAFKIGAVVTFIGWVQKAADWVHRLINFLRDVATKAWNIVVKVTLHDPGGIFGKIKSGVGSVVQTVTTVPPVRPAAGGFIPMMPGAVRGKDSVPALLTPGEVVLNRAQQAAFGGPQVFKEMFGFAGGGIVGKKKPKHKPPKLPASISRAEARAAGTPSVDDDIAAVQQEENWINQQLGRKDLTRRERESLQLRRIRVRNRLKRLRERRRKAKARERTDLPKAIQLRIATARANDDDRALLSALKAAEAWYSNQLRKAKTIDAKIALTEALDGVREEIKSLEESLREETEAPNETEDLRAQIGQLQERLRVSQVGEQLANAFVATGVFGGGGGHGGGQAPQIVLQSLVMPDDRMLQHAGRVVADAFGRQGFRPATQFRTGA